MLMTAQRHFILTFQALLLVFFVSVPASSFADEHLEFLRFSDQVGGRQSSVYDIYRGDHDFIWFATDTDGLLRYDGYEFALWSESILATEERISFGALWMTGGNTLWAATWGRGLLSWNTNAQELTEFRFDPRNEHSLRDDRVQTLFQDTEGKLWVGTLAGLNYVQLNEASDVWEVRSLGEQHPLSRERIWRIAESGERYWVATTQGLYEITKDFSDWRQHLPNPEQFGENRLNEIRTVFIYNEEVWVGTDEGVFIFEPQSERFEPILLPVESQYVNALRINDFGVMPVGGQGTPTVWVGSEDGLFFIKPETKQYRTVNDGVWRLLPDVDIRTIQFDASGGGWIGARNQGIFYTRNEEPAFQPLANQTAKSESLSLSRSVFKVQYDDAGGLWLGTADGVLHRAPGGDEWEKVPVANNEAIGRVEALYVDRTGALWVGANRALYRMHPNDRFELNRMSSIYEQLGLSENSVTALYEDEQGKLFLGFWGIGVAAYDLDTAETQWQLRALDGLRGDLVYDFVQVPEGGEWMITRYSGLFYRAHAGSDWLHYPIPEHISLKPGSLLCGHSWRAKELWLCSDIGAWRLNTETGEFSSLHQALGLPQERVVGLLSDQQDNIWMLTSSGLTRYAPTEQNVVTFGFNDGLPAIDFLRQAMAVDTEGQLTIGTVRGSFEFQPSELRVNSKPPRVGLSRISVNDTDITGSVGLNAPHVTLAHSDRAITIAYSILDFHDTSRNTGRFRLVGLNEQWSAWSAQRVITFGSLPAGAYTLEIEGRNSFGIEAQEPLRIKLFVATPWWQTIWAWLGLITALSAIFWGALRWRVQTLQRVNQRLDDLVKARTEALEAANQQLQRQSHTDYLTQLLNRRGFTERFKWLQGQAKRKGTSFALVLFDVDNFKQFNDSYGHDAGDQVLVALSKELISRIREQDVAARWGG